MSRRDEFSSVHGTCRIKSPQSWCIMEPEDPDDVLSSYDTNCSIIVTQMAKQGNMETPTGRYSEHFVLYKSSKFLCPLQQQCKNKRHLQ